MYIYIYQLTIYCYVIIYIYILYIYSVLQYIYIGNQQLENCAAGISGHTFSGFLLMCLHIVLLDSLAKTVSG